MIAQISLQAHIDHDTYKALVVDNKVVAPVRDETRLTELLGQGGNALLLTLGQLLPSRRTVERPRRHLHRTMS